MISNPLSLFAVAALSAPAFSQSTPLKVPPVFHPVADAKTEAQVFPKATAPSHPASMRRIATPSTVTPKPNAAHVARTSVDNTRLYFDASAEDALWVRGARWKASFGSQATVFIPFFGSRAPKNYPLAMRIASVTSGGEPIAFESAATAIRSGNQVRFERGGVTEVYDLGLDSIEQSFVFASLPNHGDLELRMSVESELARTQTPEGIVLANDQGRVVLGRITVRDSVGHEQTIESELAGGELRIVVPARFLETAVFPVTIDPLISVFAIDADALDEIYPDVAYDATSGNYMTVEQVFFSGSDSDVYSILSDASGNILIGGYVDLTTADWQYPKVANNGFASQFMVVAEVSTTTPVSIQGRQASATGVSFGNVLTINGAETGNKHRPDIGGDPTLLPPTYYFITWQRNFSGTDTDIHGALITPSGNNVLGTILVDNSASTLDNSPRISKSDGASPYDSQVWTIVWTHVFSSIDRDVYASQVAWNGTITRPTFTIDGSAEDDEFPVVSSIQDEIGGVRRYMVAAQRNSASTVDIFGWAFDATGFLASGDLSSMESNGSQTPLHLGPAIDCDGQRFAVMDAEPTVGHSDYDTWISTFDCVGSIIVPVESQQVMGASSVDEYRPAIVSNHSGGGSAARFMAVWEQSNATEVDTYGGLYDMPAFTYFCFPGGDAMPCPCGNDPTLPGVGCNNSASTGGAQLSAVGSPIGDTVVLSTSRALPNASAIYLQGDVSIDGGVAFGDGLRCMGGHLVRLALKHSVGGASSYPESGDLSISARSAQLGFPIQPGSQRYYQAYYRDPANFGCAATFNVTNGVIIDW